MAAAGAGPGPGPGAPPGLEAALQKLALRRKKVLSAEEMELFELAQAAGGAMDPDVFKILLDLLKLNVAPLAVFQMLKSMCAGQRAASDSQDPAAAPLPTPSVPETRGQSRAGATGGQPLALGAFGPEWPGLSVRGHIRWLAPWAPIPSLDFAIFHPGACPSTWGGRRVGDPKPGRPRWDSAIRFSASLHSGLFPTKLGTGGFGSFLPGGVSLYFSPQGAGRAEAFLSSLVGPPTRPRSCSESGQ